VIAAQALHVFTEGSQSVPPVHCATLVHATHFPLPAGGTRHAGVPLVCAMHS
jgi:hypothetical protein